jgi:hypothetical protein
MNELDKLIEFFPDADEDFLKTQLNSHSFNELIDYLLSNDYPKKQNIPKISIPSPIKKSNSPPAQINFEKYDAPVSQAYKLVYFGFYCFLILGNTLVNISLINFLM